MDEVDQVYQIRRFVPGYLEVSHCVVDLLQHSALYIHDSLITHCWVLLISVSLEVIYEIIDKNRLCEMIASCWNVLVYPADYLSDFSPALVSAQVKLERNRVQDP